MLMWNSFGSFFNITLYLDYFFGPIIVSLYMNTHNIILCNFYNMLNSIFNFVAT